MSRDEELLTVSCIKCGMPCRGATHYWFEHHGPGLDEPMYEVIWDTTCDCPEWNGDAPTEQVSDFYTEMEARLEAEEARVIRQQTEPQSEAAIHFAADD